MIRANHHRGCAIKFEWAGRESAGESAACCRMALPSVSQASVRRVALRRFPRTGWTIRLPRAPWIPMDQPGLMTERAYMYTSVYIAI